MAIPPDYVLFFGDHMSDAVALIKSLVRTSKHSPSVRRLLDEANDTLQLEFSRLSRLEHGWDKKFESLIELAETNATTEARNGGQNGVLSCALCCIGRLGELVAQADLDSSILGTSSSSQQPVEVVGLCMGQLPAAVALAARDTSQIFTLAREILQITIRMSCSIWYRMRLIDPSPRSWSQTYLRVSAERTTTILQQFHEKCKIPELHRVAVGVTSTGFVTLFGPPSALAKLQTWPGAEDLRNATQVSTEAGGCVHSPYLPGLDITEILGGCSREFLDWPLNPTHKARMASPDRLTYYNQTTLGGLLAAIIEDIAHNVLRLDGTLESCASRLKNGGRTENIRLVVMGQNGHVPAMIGALKAANIGHEIINSNSPASGIPSAISSRGHEGALLSNRGQSGLIAIIGMSGRFPDNDTVQGFWEDLIDGKTHIREVPPDRFDVKSWYDPTLEAKNSTIATKGAWLANPGHFDHRLFNISPREAAQIDPVHRHLLTCTYEALQHAGYNPGASLSMDGCNISTFFGQLGEDWHDIIHEQGADIYYVPGIARTFGPSRINYHFKFGGGSYAVDSACASSITTIVLACQALAARKCDMAVAAGGSMMYTPVPFSGLSRSGMISSTDGCRAFHDDADGYARGEGVGVVVLKRLEDALMDNDNILGVIRGSARTYSTTTTSITHPSHESQERVYRRVLAQSSLDASEVAYVEMHGTGTQAGDFEEMTSVINIMAPPGSRSRTNPLTVGTVKAAVGHGEAAAGVTALIKILLMLRHKVIPGQPGWPFKINHRFPPLDPLNVRIATQNYPLKPSPKGDKKIKVMLNSFDASGGESCLAIEEAPRAAGGEARVRDPRTTHVVALSGRTSTSLARNRQRLLEWLELHSDARLEDVAYTTTARRMHEPLRAAYVSKSVADLIQQLHEASVNDMDPKAKPKLAGRIFCFTGQGCHYPAMGSLLYNTNKTFREKLLIYQKMATSMGLPRFLDIITDPELLDQVSSTQIQMAIVALEIGVAETLAHYGVTPTAVMGHSLGEYAALCVAGVLSIGDALYLVGHRSLLMERHITPKTYAMLATSIAADKLAAEYTSLGLSSCNIACKNAPMVTVASGTVGDIEKLEVHMKAQGARTKLLRVPYGFHSSQVEPILDEFVQVASGVEFRAPSLPVVSSYLGRIVPAGDTKTFGPQYLRDQCRGTVDFLSAVQAVAAAEKASISKVLWVETGPDPVLIGFVRFTLPDLPPANLKGAIKSTPSDDNWSTLSGVLKAAYESGVDVDWPEFHKNFKNSVRLLELPLYAFDFKNFWHEPFKRPETLEKDSISSSGTAVVRPCSCQQAPASSLKPSLPGFPTTSLPTVEYEDVNIITGDMEAVFSADTAEEKLLSAIQGHVVHGHVICPMSVLVDMALTAAKYCHFRLHGEIETPVMSVTDIEMNHALVLHPDVSRKPIIKVKAVMRKSQRSAVIEFSWIKPDGQTANPKAETGGSCTVKFEEFEKWPASVNNSLFLVKARIDSLRAASREDKAHRLLKPVVYRMFSETVDYSEPFRGIDEAIVALDCKDAIAKVTLSPKTPPGNFVMNPFWTDALTHLGGFFLNSGLRYGQEDLLCMARGFESWRVVGHGKQMMSGKTYTNYTFMQDVEGNFVIGDCYIFDEDDNLVQTLLGLKFQKLKRSVMQAAFGTNSASNSSAPEPAKIGRQTTTYRPAMTQDAQPAPALAKTISNADEETMSTSLALPTPLDSTSDNTADAEYLLQMIMSIVAREAGCRIDDLVNDVVFADLGIDSLMGISILTGIKRESGIDLDSTFFIQFETVGEARIALNEILGIGGPEDAIETGLESSCNLDLPSPTRHLPHNLRDLPMPHENGMQDFAITSKLSNRQASPLSLHSASDLPTPPPETASVTAYAPAPEISAKLVHLSGPKAESSTKLFLFADETGSSLSCIQLPAVTDSEGLALSVWGVESPFQKHVDDFKGHQIQDIAKLSLISIRKRFPQVSRPFLLGGLGGGAAVAIEVARLVESDSPGSNTGLVLLDPSMTPNGVDVALSAPGMRLTPVQKRHSEIFIEAMRIYNEVLCSLGTMKTKAVAIVPESPSSEDQRLLAQILPDVQLKTVHAATGKGGLVRFPAIERTSQRYAEGVKEMGF